MDRGPEGARDMRWAQQRASGSIRVPYGAAENMPGEGAPGSTGVSVRPSGYDDAVGVRKELRYYGRRDGEEWGRPMRMGVEWSRRMSPGEFRVPGRREPYPEGTMGLDFDPSRMDSLRADCGRVDGYAGISLRLPVGERVRRCPSRVPAGSTVEYLVHMGGDGTAAVTRGREPVVERTVDEFPGAVGFADRARGPGVPVSGDGTATIGKGEGDAD